MSTWKEHHPTTTMAATMLTSRASAKMTFGGTFGSKKGTKAATKGGRKQAPAPSGATVYPEPGTYPGGDGETIIPFTDEKNAEREIIHGRFAMLGVTGAWAAENGTGIPWFEAGALCTPDDCTAIADKFPGAIAPLAPEGSGYPSYWAVIGIEIVLMGAAEGYRTGLIDPAFDELTVGDANPGGRFDPLNLAESGDLDELKLKELKHCRLSMGAWLGCIWQAIATGEGPISNWREHVADPVHNNIITAQYAPWL